ncbi:uncharacterized protein [Symphalangus syndactylus]|uniref:uncharacterized protein isoform X2 n=1 Tax=Symphalangus syndactylus TaxID=9590 RepID=UPI0024419951|nr:uncharacterized protein LOC129478674 isoform X3 [Symphalangus syndactylus]
MSSSSLSWSSGMNPSTPWSCVLSEVASPCTALVPPGRTETASQEAMGLFTKWSRSLGFLSQQQAQLQKDLTCAHKILPGWRPQGPVTSASVYPPCSAAPGAQHQLRIKRFHSKPRMLLTGGQPGNCGEDGGGHHQGPSHRTIEPAAKKTHAQPSPLPEPLWVFGHPNSGPGSEVGAGQGTQPGREPAVMSTRTMAGVPQAPRIAQDKRDVVGGAQRGPRSPRLRLLWAGVVALAWAGTGTPDARACRSSCVLMGVGGCLPSWEKHRPWGPRGWMQGWGL